MTITAETIATALLEEGHTTAGLTDAELRESIATFGATITVVELRETMHKLEFENEQIDEGTLPAFLSRFPCSTPDKCREYLKALAASKWAYHLDDDALDIGGDHADNAAGLMGRRVLCSESLGEDGMWEAYNPTNDE